MSASDRTQQMLDYYREKRVEAQRDFYESRAARFRSRDRLLRIVSGFLMLLAGLSSALGFLFQVESGLKTFWDVLPVVLPALSTALLTIRNVHQYENTQYLYRQTYIRLSDLQHQNAELAQPDLDAKIAAFIEQVESSIANENVQWLSRSSDVQPARAPGGGAPGPG